MTSTVVFAIIAALLFALPFLAKRRFGILGLALAAGAVLSNLLVGSITPIIASTGVLLVKPPLESVVAATVILLPALLLLFSSPQQHSMVRRVIGSITFSLLAIAFLLEALGSALVIEGVGETIYVFLTQNKSTIIAIGLLLAILDLFFVKIPKLGKGKESGKH